MVSVRRFEDRDAAGLAGLMAEMARLYGAAIDPNLAVAEDVIHQSRTVEIIVALGNGPLLGFATFASLYPVAGLISFTYIQQLYVGLHARRAGVATRLMAEVARIAKARGSTRLEWSTEPANMAARALYEGLGAIGSDKVQYTIEGAALDRLAG